MRRRNLVSQVMVAPSWPGDHPRIAVSIDDSGRALEAPGIGKHGTTVTHGNSRKRNAADRGSDGGKRRKNGDFTLLRADIYFQDR